MSKGNSSANLSQGGKNGLIRCWNSLHFSAEVSWLEEQPPQSVVFVILQLNRIHFTKSTSPFLLWLTRNTEPCSWSEQNRQVFKNLKQSFLLRFGFECFRQYAYIIMTKRSNVQPFISHLGISITDILIERYLGSTLLLKYTTWLSLVGSKSTSRTDFNFSKRCIFSCDRLISTPHGAYQRCKKMFGVIFCHFHYLLQRLWYFFASEDALLDSHQTAWLSLAPSNLSSYWLHSLDHYLAGIFLFHHHSKVILSVNVMNSPQSWWLL